MELVLTAVAVAVLMALQLVPGRLHIDDRRRGPLLSAAGGFAVGYVFLRLLPDLAVHADVIEERLGHRVALPDRSGHLLALVGLVVFYGLEHLARSGAAERRKERERSSEARLAAVLVGAFSLYYALIGYLLGTRLEAGAGALAVYTVAMGVHFLSVDIGLELRHRAAYTRFGRWVLALAVAAGWALGAVTTLPAPVLAAMLSLLAGGVVLVVLKEELPAERDGRWVPFAAGVTLAVGLLSLL